MSVSSYILIILYSFSKFLASPYNEKDITFVLQLSKELKIDYCIFVQNNKDQENPISKIKILSSIESYTTILGYENVVDLINQRNDVNYKEIIVLKHTFTEIEKLLNQLDEMPALHKISRYTWLALMEEQHLIENKPLAVPYDCEFLLVFKGDATSFEIVEIFQINNDYFSLSYGAWDFKKGLDIDQDFFYSRRADLNQTVVRRAYLWNMTEAEKEIQQQLYTEVLNDMSNIMNFRILNTEDFFDNETGHFITLGTEYKGPIIYGNLAYVYPDTSATNSIRLLLQNTLYFYIKKPHFSLKWDFFLQPFEKNFWSAVIISIIIGTFFFLLMQRFVPKNKKSIIDSTFLVLECFCNQDGGVQTENISTRIACFSFAITSIVVVASFGAVITSYLAIRIPELPFTDLKTFSENEKYQLLMFPYVEYLFNIMGNLTAEIDNRLIRVEEHDNRTERLCTEKIAIIGQDDDLQRIKVRCDLHRINSPVHDMYKALVLRSNNPLQKALNYQNIRFSEYGIQNRMQYLLRNSAFDKGNEDTFQNIELEQIIGLLLIFVIGIILSTTILLGEVILNYFGKEMIRGWREKFLYCRGRCMSKKMKKKKHGANFSRTHGTKKFKLFMRLRPKTY